MTPRKQAAPPRITLAVRVQENVKKLRRKANLSQEGLATRAGLSVSYISMIEQKKRSPPLETIEDLAKGLSVDPLELLAAVQ